MVLKKETEGGPDRVGVWAGQGWDYWGRVSVCDRKEDSWVIPNGTFCGRKEEEVYETTIWGYCHHRPFSGI